MPKKTFQEDIELDAKMVYASMAGMFVPFAIQAGLKPNEAFGRAEWLRKQPSEYLDKVVKRVQELELEDQQKKAKESKKNE